MNRKRTLISQRKEVARILQRFYQGLSPQEKVLEGRLEHLSIKPYPQHLAIHDQNFPQDL